MRKEEKVPAVYLKQFCIINSVACFNFLKGISYLDNLINHTNSCTRKESNALDLLWICPSYAIFWWCQSRLSWTCIHRMEKRKKKKIVSLAWFSFHCPRGISVYSTASEFRSSGLKYNDINRRDRKSSRENEYSKIAWLRSNKVEQCCTTIYIDRTWMLMD